MLLHTETRHFTLGSCAEFTVIALSNSPLLAQLSGEFRSSSSCSHSVFIASVLNDPLLANKIVMIDDPMSSLDVNRRHQIRTILKKIRAKTQQLIVLAHDGFSFATCETCSGKKTKARRPCFFKW